MVWDLRADLLEDGLFLSLPNRERCGKHRSPTLRKYVPASSGAVSGFLRPGGISRRETLGEGLGVGSGSGSGSR